MNHSLILKMFNDNLAFVYYDYPNILYHSQIAKARNWTLEQLENIVNRIVEQKLAQHQEAICQHVEPCRNTLMGK